MYVDCVNCGLWILLRNCICHAIIIIFSVAAYLLEYVEYMYCLLLTSHTNRCRAFCFHTVHVTVSYKHACGNLKLQCTWRQVMAWLDFEVERSKVKSQWDPVWSKITCSRMHLSGEGVLVCNSLSKTIWFLSNLFHLLVKMLTLNLCLFTLYVCNVDNPPQLSL